MGTLHIKFEDYPDDAEAGEYESFIVDASEYLITDDTLINSAAFTSEQGLIVPVEMVIPLKDGNLFSVRIPSEIATGDYQFKVSVVSLADPTKTAIIETDNAIEIQGESDWNDPPIISSVHFRNHPTTIPAADLTSDALVINGENLNHVTALKLISPSVLFNITTHSKKVMTAKAISAPRVQGLKMVFVEFEYTITNEQGEFVESGEVRSNTPLRIQGD
jgi:hypothetical protein